MEEFKNFIILVEKMRINQKNYARIHDFSSKKEAEKLEKKVDEAIRNFNKKDEEAQQMNLDL